MSIGTLIVRPISAKLTHDTEFFGTMDPYVIVTLGSQTQRTRACRNGGKHPFWDEQLIFQVSGPNDDFLRIRVMDKETFSSDDHIGQGTFPLSRLAGNIFEENIRLEYKRGKHAGDLKLGVQMMIGGGSYPPGMPQPGYFQPGFPGYPPPQYPGSYPPPQYPGNYPPPQYPGSYPPPQYPGSYPPPQYPGYPGPQYPGGYPPQYAGYPVPQYPGAYPPPQYQVGPGVYPPGAYPTAPPPGPK